MTRKTSSKLSLNKETVRNLSTSDLRRAVGGARPISSIACPTLTFSAFCPR